MPSSKTCSPRQAPKGAPSLRQLRRLPKILDFRSPLANSRASDFLPIARVVLARAERASMVTSMPATRHLQVSSPSTRMRSARFRDLKICHSPDAQQQAYRIRCYATPSPSLVLQATTCPAACHAHHAQQTNLVLYVGCSHISCLSLQPK